MIDLHFKLLPSYNRTKHYLLGKPRLISVSFIRLSAVWWYATLLNIFDYPG